MSAKFFYLFIVFGIILVGVAVYSFFSGSVNGNTVIVCDLILALFAFYRAYRIYKQRMTRN